MKNLLLVYTSRSARTDTLVEALSEGAGQVPDEVALRVRRAEEASLGDLLWANGLLLGTPENFGYMAGLMKDFFDRTFYPAEGKTVGLPYALLVSAGNDGRGAVLAVERIALGYRWVRVAEALIIKGVLDEASLERCRELGQTLAVGLSMGIF